MAPRILGKSWNDFETPRTARRGLAGVCALTACCLLALTANGTFDRAIAATALPRSNVPLPPPRPADIGGERTPAGISAPARLKIPPRKETSRPIPPPPPHPVVAPGPMKPRRAAIRACIEQWREMKRSGEAAGRLWRTFSRGCMRRHRRTTQGR